MKFLVTIVFMTMSVILGGGALAQETSGLGPVTGYPLPRYVSLKASVANIRRGPGENYPIDWVLVRSGTPLQITAEYGDWLRVRDEDGAGGWIYKKLLIGNRTVVITGQRIALHETPSDTSRTTALAEKGVIAALKSCERTWCEIKAEGHTGWVQKTDIWGVGAAELRD